MRQLLDFIDKAHPDQVCLLRRSIYGLKQSSWLWYRRLKDFLSWLGFKESLIDASLFISTNNQVIYVLVFVDDMIVSNDNQSTIGQLMSTMN